MLQKSQFRAIFIKVGVGILLFAISQIISINYIKSRPTEYAATAQLLTLFKGDSGLIAPYEANDGMNFARTQIGNYPQLVKTESVLGPVIEKLHLNTSVGGLASRVNLTNSEGSFILNITVNSNSPVEAANIANGVAEQLSILTSSQSFATGKIFIQLKSIQKAEIPALPISPQVKPLFYKGLAVGTFLAFLPTIFMYAFTERISNAAFAKEVIKAPLLGEISHKVFAGLQNIPIIEDPEGKEAQAFRYMKANLVALTGRQVTQVTKGQIYLFTSSHKAVAGTVASTNIAASLADEGKRVLLIDACTQDAWITKRFGLNNLVGLSDILLGKAQIQEATHCYKTSNLYIMPAGNSKLETAIMRHTLVVSSIFDQLKQHFDYILVCSDTIKAPSSAVILGNISDGYVLTELEDTSKNSLSRAVDDINASKTPIVGFIFGN